MIVLKAPMYLIVITSIYSLAYSTYNIYNLIMTFDNTPYKISNAFLDCISTQDYEFFFILIIQYGMIFIDLSFLRVADIGVPRGWKFVVYVIYSWIYINITKFKLRYRLTVYFSKKYITGFRKFSILDIFLGYFTARSLSIIHVYNTILDTFDKLIYRPIARIPNRTITKTESNRSAAFYSAMTGLSSIKAYSDSFKLIWFGKLRLYYNRFSTSSNLVPAGLFFSTFCQKYVNLIWDNNLKPHEILFIVFSHFTFVSEVLNTNLYMESFLTTQINTEGSEITGPDGSRLRIQMKLPEIKSQIQESLGIIAL